MHPDTGQQLFVESEIGLRRQSYLKTELRYEIPCTWLDWYDESDRVLRLHPFSLWDLVERQLRTSFRYETPLPDPPAIHAENIYIRCQPWPDCDARAAAGASTSTYDNEGDELQQK